MLNGGTPGHFFAPPLYLYLSPVFFLRENLASHAYANPPPSAILFITQVNRFLLSLPKCAPLLLCSVGCRFPLTLFFPALGARTPACYFAFPVAGTRPSPQIPLPQQSGDGVVLPKHPMRPLPPSAMPSAHRCVPYLTHLGSILGAQAGFFFTLAYPHLSKRA